MKIKTPEELLHFMKLEQELIHNTRGDFRVQTLKYQGAVKRAIREVHQSIESYRGEVSSDRN